MKRHNWVRDWDKSNLIRGVYTCSVCRTTVTAQGIQTADGVATQKGLSDCDKQLVLQVHDE